MIVQAYGVYGDARYERLATLSVAHLYNLRHQASYQATRAHWTKTRGCAVPITVKRYERQKVTAEDGAWRHVKITLKPNNPDFKAIVLTCEDEGSVKVIAEMLGVVG